MSPPQGPPTLEAVLCCRTQRPLCFRVSDNVHLLVRPGRGRRSAREPAPPGCPLFVDEFICSLLSDQKRWPHRRLAESSRRLGLWASSFSHLKLL